MSAILVGVNFISKAADMGCSIFNLAQTLADIKNGIIIDDCMGKIRCPFAKPLLMGNEEEEDNIFIEYVSALANSPTHNLEQRSFVKDEHGLFVNKLFEQVTDKGVPIPRPMKSCHPHWVLSYRGCPLTCGEGKTSWGNTTEGLQYTNLCATNILNYLPEGSANIIMHSSNVRITLQASKIIENTAKIAVYQKKCMPYFIEPSVAEPEKSKVTNPLLLLYHYEKVEKQYLTDKLFVYLNTRAKSATDKQQNLYNEAEQRLHRKYSSGEMIT